MTNIYTISRKIHRILVLIILTSGLIMAITGILLKYSSFTIEHLQFVNLGFVRYWHNQLSTYFGIALVLMIITGTWMYFYPSWAAHKAKKRQENKPTDTPQA